MVRSRTSPLDPVNIQGMRRSLAVCVLGALCLCACGLLPLSSGGADAGQVDNTIYPDGGDGALSTMYLEYIDKATQRNNMHSCPSGAFMTGLHLGNNYNLCATGFGSYTSDSVVSTTDGGTVMCPAGMGATGVSALNKQLACAALGPMGHTNADDPAPGTQRCNMHACPAGTVMVGHNADTNLLICAKPDGGALTGSTSCN